MIPVWECIDWLWLGCTQCHQVLQLVWCTNSPCAGWRFTWFGLCLQYLCPLIQLVWPLFSWSYPYSVGLNLIQPVWPLFSQSDPYSVGLTPIQLVWLHRAPVGVEVHLVWSVPAVPGSSYLASLTPDSAGLTLIQPVWPFSWSDPLFSQSDPYSADPYSASLTPIQLTLIQPVWPLFSWCGEYQQPLWGLKVHCELSVPAVSGSLYLVHWERETGF